jgi:hypothetical protein
MFEEHPNFIAPEGNEIIWRYMEFQRLVSLHSTQQLWFTSRKKLQEQDQFEGVYPDTEPIDELRGVYETPSDCLKTLSMLFRITSQSSPAVVSAAVRLVAR